MSKDPFTPSYFAGKNSAFINDKVDKLMQFLSSTYPDDYITAEGLFKYYDRELGEYRSQLNHSTRRQWNNFLSEHYKSIQIADATNEEAAYLLDCAEASKINTHKHVKHD